MQVSPLHLVYTCSTDKLLTHGMAGTVDIQEVFLDSCAGCWLALCLALCLSSCRFIATSILLRLSR